MSLDVAVGLAVGLALGFSLGAGLMAWRAFRIELRRRSNAGMSATIARLWPSDLPTRSAADIIAGRIVVVLGAEVYELPVLPQNAGRRWLASLDDSFAELLADVSETESTADGIARLMAYSSSMYEVLLAYDQAHVLPPAEVVGEVATSAQIFRAVVEVWRAENPLAATLAGMTVDPSPTPSSESPSLSPESLDGLPGSSGTSSPANSSSSTSTRPRTASSSRARASSTAGSKP